MENLTSFITPNDSAIVASTDSQAIQSAIKLAKEKGLNKVVVPRINARTNEPIWNIDTAIKLPSDITVVLDDCHLRMVDGVFSNMFVNENFGTELGATQEGRQKNIHIVGIGNAILDGGLPNGLNERTSSKNGFPPVFHNLTINMFNVENFSVKNISVTDQRWWALCFCFCRTGVIRDIRFQLTRHDVQCDETWTNMDGIDIRIGCSNIEISNIVGEVGDDVVALTALGPLGGKAVDGEDTTIHDIYINNVRGITSQCAIVRLLCQKGYKVRRVSINNIYEISRVGKEATASYLLRIGDDGYYRDPADRSQMGDLADICAENLFSHSCTAVGLACNVKNFSCRNVYVYDNGGYAVVLGQVEAYEKFAYEKNMKEVLTPCRIYHSSNAYYMENLVSEPTGHRAEMENIYVENIFYNTNAKKAKGVIGFNRVELKNVNIKNVCNDTSLPTVAYFNMDEPKFNLE